MLCKTTMRAALAPMIGLLGVVLATTAGATITIGESQEKGENPSLKVAGETLSKAQSNLVAGYLNFYKIAATPTDLALTVDTDILLPTVTNYYVRYVFSGGRGIVFSRALETNDLSAGGIAASAIAYQGGINQNVVIFQVGDNYPLGATFRLDLSGMPDDGETMEVNEILGGLAVAGLGSHTVTMSIHDSLTNARAGTDAAFSAGPTEVINVSRAVYGKITPAVDIANVSTPVSEGGPFRRFVPAADGSGADSGVLATTFVGVNTQLRHAVTGFPVTADIISATNAVATSEAGNFAVSLNEGGTVNTSVRKPWMLSEETDCMSGPLELGVTNGTLATYGEEDPDDTGPLLKTDHTPEAIASATMASGRAANATGTNYFCVLVAGNTEPIPEIGDPMTMDAYMLSLTPVLAAGADSPLHPGTIGPSPAGAIDRNGTTVHLTYLTTNPEVDQRIVLVNRGADAVAFWVEDDSFNLEAGTTVTNGLGIDMGHMVPGHGRLVLKTPDHIMLEGQQRASATVNVAAPTRDIDVMTIQRSPATGEVDTTVYQHAEN